MYAALTVSSDAYNYLFLSIILNPALIYLSYMFYETAHAYYIPQMRVAVEKPEVKEEPEIEEPEVEEEEEDIPEEIVEDDTSPFVEFLLVTI